ncbi:MAG TPA: hypothetical protein VES59_06000 [Bacteroidota bacterium]|nr:hypothetical protein [Bacteroidota bacterium]
MFQEWKLDRMALKALEADIDKKAIALDEAIHRLERIINRVRKTLPNLLADFKHALENWQGKHVSQPISHPYEIDDDIQRAVRYTIYGIAGLGFEAVMAGIIFHDRFGIGAWWGGVFAIASGIFAEGIALLTLQHATQPQTTRRRLNLLMKVSAVQFVISFGILIYVMRSADPETLITMHSLFSFSIFSASVTLLGLLGSIFGQRTIHLWSRHHTKHYERMGELLHHAEALQNKLRWELAEFNASKAGSRVNHKIGEVATQKHHDQENHGAGAHAAEEGNQATVSVHRIPDLSELAKVHSSQGEHP